MTFTCFQRSSFVLVYFLPTAFSTMRNDEAKEQTLNRGSRQRLELSKMSVSHLSRPAPSQRYLLNPKVPKLSLRELGRSSQGSDLGRNLGPSRLSDLPQVIMLQDLQRLVFALSIDLGFAHLPSSMLGFFSMFQAADGLFVLLPMHFTSRATPKVNPGRVRCYEYGDSYAALAPIHHRTSSIIVLSLPNQPGSCRFSAKASPTASDLLTMTLVRHAMGIAANAWEIFDQSSYHMANG